MKNLAAWFAGKKTILTAALVAVLTILGFWLGKLTPAQALQLLSVAGFAVGLGSKLQRYLPQILIGLQGLAEAIADLKASQPAMAVDAIGATAEKLLTSSPGITVGPQFAGVITVHPPAAAVTITQPAPGAEAAK